MNTKTVPLSESIGPMLSTLAEGGVVIFSSANTYGLLANAEDPEATDRIYELKDRDRTKPLGYLSSPRRASEVGIITPEALRAISLWPCPLSIVVPKTNRVPEYITRLASILLVCPDPTSIELVDQAPFLIACTSANLAGQAPVNAFEDARAIFEGKVPLIVDGGRSRYGASGTMIDFSKPVPTILRLGPYSVEELKKTVRDVIVADGLLR